MSEPSAWWEAELDRQRVADRNIQVILESLAWERRAWSEAREADPARYRSSAPLTQARCPEHDLELPCGSCAADRKAAR
jgi:hypothetical protein